jgi:hypothetical protein
MLSDLVAAEEQGSMLSEEELVATCAMLLVGGHETTTHLIGNATLALLRHPVELEKLRARPELLPAAVEELLRYDSAAFSFGRCALEDIELDGHTIRKGQYVLCSVLAANRDPAVFPDPDRLDVERKIERNVGFGYGIHFCIGAAVARLETQIALQAIFSRLHRLSLTEEPLVHHQSMAAHGLVSLPVTFEAQAVG